MIRLMLIAIFLVLFGIFSIPLYAVQAVRGRYDEKGRFAFAQKVTVTAFRIVLRLAGVKATVLGTERIPKEEAVLYVSNHRSYFDVLMGYTTVPTLTSFVSKKEIQKIPCVRSWMKYMKCLFLDRENIKEGLKTILQGIAQIKEGYSVFIMPEGTRNHGEEMLPFHEGSFKFAEKSGCAIVPVAMVHTDDIWEKHMPWIRSAHVVVEYGDPIYIKDLPKEKRMHLGASVRDVIAEMLAEIENMH